MNLPFPDATLETVQPLEMAAADYLNHVRQRPDGVTLTAALLAAERTAKHQHWMLKPEALHGTWRLCFTAPKQPNYRSGQPTGNGFYLPRWVNAAISLDPNPDADSPLAIRNQLQIGPLNLTFSGPARFNPKQNLLLFDFTHLQLALGGRVVLQTPVRGGEAKRSQFAQTGVSKLPFFGFFAVTDRVIAARGRGGGLALWARPNPTL